MESIFDWDSIEQELAAIEDPNKKTWWNEALWKRIGGIALFFIVTYAVSSLIRYPEATIGWNGWVFNYNRFIDVCLSSVAPVILLGLKIQTNLRSFVKKKQVEKFVREKIAEKDKEIAELKRQLNDRCITLEANTEAKAILNGVS